MKRFNHVYFGIFLLLLISCEKNDDPIEVKDPAPPFSGTFFLDPDIFTNSDRTTFLNLSFEGQDSRTMFDRRVDDWITVEAFLFQANYDDGLTTLIQVNPEFQTQILAENEATKYAEVIGRLPTVLRKDVETVWIHKGTELFGGGDKSILIHVGQTVNYENDGILEETLLHEASHTSLDAMHASSAGWINSQNSDGNFISTYARDNKLREDIAESFLVYVAVRYRSDRISSSLEKTIVETIPNRIEYFNNQSFDMYPFE